MVCFYRLGNCRFFRRWLLYCSGLGRSRFFMHRLWRRNNLVDLLGAHNRLLGLPSRSSLHDRYRC
jgi:hypothetical protein